MVTVCYYVRTSDSVGSCLQARKKGFWALVVHTYNPSYSVLGLSVKTAMLEPDSLPVCR
jgi:hypothetical protein